MLIFSAEILLFWLFLVVAISLAVCLKTCLDLIGFLNRPALERYTGDKSSLYGLCVLQIQHLFIHSVVILFHGISYCCYILFNCIVCIGWLVTIETLPVWSLIELPAQSKQNIPIALEEPVHKNAFLSCLSVLFFELL